MANTTYKRILVAIDIADHSRAVLSRASEIAKQNDNAELHVIHVVHFSAPAFPGSYSENIRETIYDNCSEEFEKLCEEFGVDKPHRHLGIGSPKYHILGFAEKIDADLIVLGSYGEQHLLPATFGSTAGSILAKAHCDVLTVSILEFLKQRDTKARESEAITE